MTRTLTLIFAALALMIGSFVWFVATWDASKEQPIGIISPKIPAPQGLPDAGTVFTGKALS